MEEKPKKCSNILLHNLDGTHDKNKCKWCGKSVKEMREEYEKEWNLKKT